MKIYNVIKEYSNEELLETIDDLNNYILVHTNPEIKIGTFSSKIFELLRYCGWIPERSFDSVHKLESILNFEYNKRKHDNLIK